MLKKEKCQAVFQSSSAIYIPTRDVGEIWFLCSLSAFGNASFPPCYSDSCAFTLLPFLFRFYE